MGLKKKRWKKKHFLGVKELCPIPTTLPYASKFEIVKSALIKNTGYNGLNHMSLCSLKKI